MKSKSIFKQILVPMIGIVSLFATILVIIVVIFFTYFYKKEIQNKNQNQAELMARNIQIFIDGVYGIIEDLTLNSDIRTMKTQIQTPILKECVARNPYLELLYIQGIDGMQTGRSSGELANRSNRWWFIQMMEQKESFVSKSYYSVSTGMPCSSIFFPIYDDNNLIGVFGADLKLNYLQSMIEEYSDINKGAVSFIIDGEGVVVAHPDSIQIEEQYNYKTCIKTVSSKDENGKTLIGSDGNIVTQEQNFEISKDYQDIIGAVMTGDKGVGEVKNDGKDYYVSYSPIALKGTSASWSIIILQEKSIIMKPVKQIIMILILIVLIVISLVFIVIAIIARKLTKPIMILNKLVGNASEGDFSIQADESSRNELGTLAKSFNQMTKKISGILSKITIFTKEVVQSSGHLINIEENIRLINEAVHEISQGTDSQNQDVERVMVRTGEMEEKFDQLKDKSQKLLTNAQLSIDMGKNGMNNIEELKKQNQVTIQITEDSYNTIMELEKQSRKISEIINTINEISSQTKLLALNASIEAARAGEQGRGFAVVADSIGKLALDSTIATADIEQIIQKLCKDIENTVKNMQEMKNNISNQTSAVIVVSQAFAEFDEMNYNTTVSVQTMEEMINEMHKINRSIVHAISRISDISKNTFQLTKKSSISLQNQYDGIRDVVGHVKNLSIVSSEMEVEMSKFKI